MRRVALVAVALVAGLCACGDGVRYADQLASDAEVNAAGPLPPVPLRVLVHGASFDPGGEPVPRLERLWRALQRDLARSSPHGELEVVPGTHHRIAADAPDRVIEAVREVVEAARSGG